MLCHLVCPKTSDVQVVIIFYDSASKTFDIHNIICPIVWFISKTFNYYIVIMFLSSSFKTSNNHVVIRIP